MTNNSPGSYSVSIKSFFGSWKKPDKKLPIEADKKRKKVLKPIINPIFEKCADLTEDKFWQSIFLECARGKFPRGFSFKNSLLTYRKGNKMHRLEISNSTSEVYTSTIDFFQTIAGIMSIEDRRRIEKKEEEKLLEKLNHKTELTWKDIKTEKLKDILICEFIVDICEKMEFNQDEKKELTTTIKKGFMLKYFTSNNIIMVEGKITEIDGLIYNEKTKEYEIDVEYTSRRPGRKVSGLGVEKYEKRSEIDFLEIWEKYLENLETKRIKKTRSYSSSYSHVINESEDLSRADYSTTL